jgi:proliferating cell nuclear antigen
MNFNENDTVLFLKTIQVQAIRTLFSTLKEILCDVTIVFTRKSISILEMDKNKTILVNLKLNSDKFQIYKCIKDKIIICVNMSNLNMLIGNMSNDDVLSIYIDKESYNDGIVIDLGLKFENSKKKQIICHKLRLIEPETQEYLLPDIKYLSIINLRTTDFQKIIKDLNSIADRVEIKSVGNEFRFSVDGSYSKSLVSLFSSETNEHMSFIQKPDNSVVIQGIFALKALSNITKCTQLCTNLEIYLGNNLPLTIRYEVADLGEISMSIMPLSENIDI